MKKSFFLLIFIVFLVSSNLYAEQDFTASYDPISHEASVFILPVAGIGRREVKDFIYDKMNYEVAYQDYLLVWARRGSDYIVSSRISRGEEDSFVLTMRFHLARTNKRLSERKVIFYETDDELASNIANIMTDFFMGNWNIEDELQFAQRAEPVVVVAVNEPVLEEEPRSNPFFTETVRYRFSDDWRDKLFYFEYAIIWAPRQNIFSNEWNYLNLGFSLALDMQIVSFFAMEIGVQAVQETSCGTGFNDIDLIIEIPVSLKIVLKPFRNLMIEPFAGISLTNYSVMENIIPSPMLYFAGIEFLFNTKSGIFYFEPRYAMDSNITTFLNLGQEHRRTMMQLGVGYKAGIISKLVRR